MCSSVSHEKSLKENSLNIWFKVNIFFKRCWCCSITPLNCFYVWPCDQCHVYISSSMITMVMWSVLGGLVVSILYFQAGYCGFESRSGQDKFQTTSTPSSYSTCPGLSIKWTGQCLVTDSGTKSAWVIHESKAVQIHVHNNRHCLSVPGVPGSVKNPHNNNNGYMVY